MITQKMYTRIFLFIGLLLINMNVFSQDPNLYIYLCFGQSNMEGQGTIEAQDKTVDSRFQVMEAVDCSNLGRTKGKWYKAVPPLCRCYSGLSPADYFGKTMVANLPDSIKVGVVNVSVAGCKIELYDKDNYQTYAATVESWMTSIINAYSGNPYAHFVEVAKLAQKDGVIKGILFHQGESNVGDNQWTTKVKGVYNNLINDLSLNSDSVPLLAGEVVNAAQGGICAGANSLIAALPNAIPNSYVISSKGCTDAADNLHFNSAGYRELGVRYALKMLLLLGYDTTDFKDPRVPLTPPVVIDLLDASNGFALRQNYPNPFNKITAISFEIPNVTYVSLKVYNMLGIEIAELAGKEFTPGKHTVEFDASNLSEGIYFYKMKVNNYSTNRKMILQVE
jgi:hypothetical protein